MKLYRSASYQQDVMDELARQAKVYFYGPGFSGYDIKDSIEDVLVKTPFDPDAIVIGHRWIFDDGEKVDPHPNLKLKKTSIPKVVILNKEYRCLDAKLDYIKKNDFDMAFTHHHDIDRYSEITGIEFIFWPFAFNHRSFGYMGEEKTIDVAFSGVLQNLNKNASQSDIRVMIMKRFFFTIFDVPFFKRKAFKNIEIFWNSIARNKIGKNLSYMLNKRQYLSATDYARMMRKTKVYINTLSPMGLISPRFFECMASKSLVFCEESSLYSNIFPDDLYVVFSRDLSDFQEKLLWILGNESKRSTIVEEAYKHVLSNHSWKDRVLMLLNKISFDSSYKIPNPIDTKAKV